MQSSLLAEETVFEIASVETSAEQEHRKMVRSAKPPLGNSVQT